MTKLLRAGFRRYTHSFIFWLALAVTVAVAFYSALSARDLYFDDFYIAIVFVALSVMITWLAGRECDEGIVRNKIVCGHTKGQIFLSELILGIGAVSVMFLLFAAIFAAVNSYVFTKAEADVLVKIFVDIWLVNICYSVLFVAVSSLISKRAISAVVNVVLVFALAFGAYGLRSTLNQEEYFERVEYETVTIEGEDGSTYVTNRPIEGSEQLIENPNYVDGPARVVCEILNDILPYGHIVECTDLTNDWFGYDYYKNYHPDLDATWEERSNVLSLTKEENAALTENLIFSIVVNVAVCALGYVVFRKKDFK